MFYLASASPRRRELLQQIGISFNCLPVDIDETPEAGESPAALVERLARGKAGAAASELTAADVVLGADTVVVLDEKIFGKPVDRDDACRMLSLLSDRTHEVYTAVAVIRGGESPDSESHVDSGLVQHSLVHTSRVTLAAMDRSTIAAYVDSGEPMDKAGSYAIQGLGACQVAHLDGSFSGVMGLPLYETTRLLARFGVAPDAMPATTGAVA